MYGCQESFSHIRDLAVISTVILLNKPKIQSHKELVMGDRENKMEIKSSCHVTGENFGLVFNPGNSSFQLSLELQLQNLKTTCFYFNCVFSEMNICVS